MDATSITSRGSTRTSKSRVQCDTIRHTIIWQQGPSYSRQDLLSSVEADLFTNILLSLRISYQGVSIYGWQTAGNMISLIAALIAAGLYGNIGIKVFYNNILMDIFSAPPLITRRGKIFYAAIVPIWWIIAFIIAVSALLRAPSPPPPPPPQSLL